MPNISNARRQSRNAGFQVDWRKSKKDAEKAQAEKEVAAIEAENWVDMDVDDEIDTYELDFKHHRDLMESVFNELRYLRFMDELVGTI